MEFDNQQKLIITLLTDIHAKLAIQDSLDPDFVQRMVCSGHGWALEWKYPGTFAGSGNDPEEVQYVADVLEMWSTLEESFKALDAEGQKTLSDTAGLSGRNVKFPGFDGNNEHELLSIAKIFVDDLEQWSEFSGRVNNSHMRTTDRYHRMLADFKDIRAGKLSGNDSSLLGAKHLGEVLGSRP